MNKSVIWVTSGGERSLDVNTGEFNQLVKHVSRKYEVSMLYLGFQSEHRLNYVSREFPYSHVASLSQAKKSWIAILVDLTKYIIKEKPLVCHTHHIGPSFLLVISCGLARFWGVKTKVIANYRNSKKSINSISKRAMEIFISYSAHVVVFPSRGVRNSFLLNKSGNRKWLRKIVGNRSLVINNCIDFSRFEQINNTKAYDRSLKINERVKILNVASFKEQKDHRTLLHGFSLFLKFYPGASLLLVGVNPKEEALSRMLSEYNLEPHVTILSEQSNMVPIYQHADIFVLSSLWEGLSKSALEAQAAGLPSLLSDVEGNDEIAGTFLGVSLFPPGDPFALCTALRFVVETGEAGFLKNGKSNPFDASYAANEWVNLYDRLTS